MAANEETLNRIHVNNLAWSITEEQLESYFSEFGEIETKKIPTRPKGGSKGFGFITFKTEEAAKNAVDKMNNVSIEDRRIGVVFSTSVEKKTAKEKAAQEKEEVGETTNLLVRQLAWAVKNADLKQEFESFGNLQKQKVMTTKNGKSKGYGFVVFETVEQAKAAKEAMDGKEIKGRAIEVHFSKNAGPKPRVRKPKKQDQEGKEPAEEKEEASPTKRRRKRKPRRKQKGKGDGEQPAEESTPAETSPAPAKKTRPKNKLYMKVSTECTNEDLEKLFSKHGALKKIDIPTNKEGLVRGLAYVQFESEEAAANALESVQGESLKGVALNAEYAKPRNGRRRRGPKRGKAQQQADN